MKISVSDGSLAFMETPNDEESGPAIAIRKIISAVNAFDVSNASSKTLSTLFFDDEAVASNKANDGIVETPEQIAEYMVFLAYQRWSAVNDHLGRSPSDLHWFDPCSGAGVFSRQILKKYIEEFNASDVDGLPFLTLAELSPKGLFASLCMIKHTLQKYEISLSDYLSSGRLQLHLGDTLIEFPEAQGMFFKSRNFDLVVGNPPYVRSTRMPLSYKKSLRSFFPGVFHGGADLYTYFIASGVSALRPNGIVCFISPATFARAKSGMAIRNWIARNAAIDSYIDLDETRVFDDADVHAAIYTLVSKARQSEEVDYLHVRNVEELSELCHRTAALASAAFEQPRDHGWAFHASFQALQTFAENFQNCRTISDFGIKVYSGIRPGYAKAYIVEQSVYDGFSEDIRAKWFKPIILPANIKRWRGSKKINFMLVIPHNTACLDREVEEYLAPYRVKLAARTEAEGKGKWFALRPCSYYDKMAQEKIVFPDLSSQQRFSLVDKDVYVPDGAYFIESNSRVLLGILNSSLARDYFVKRCSSVGNLNTKGRFRFKKTFVQDFPLPLSFDSNGLLQEQIIRLVDDMIAHGESDHLKSALDALVLELYKQ